MKFLANCIWFLLGGFIFSLAWLLAGILLYITLIGIPLGKQCMKAAKLSAFPFGKEVITALDEYPIINIVWAILLGWELAIGYLSAALILCVTVIGIPFGIQIMKLVKLALFPFGARIIKAS
ncbi:MAG: YccF domain-containing protein [Clostridia bacterium]|nr:YccF domain-containing protein [Clostridia bacterium]